MTDDPDDPKKPEGTRKDGKPFKQNNTRDDGSYSVGKGRPPAATQFAAGDGRKRGVRSKGGKNQKTIWTKALKGKLTIDGRTMRKDEWLAEALIRRGIKRSDRAAEVALRYAGQLDEEKERTVQLSDRDIIDEWLIQRLGEEAGMFGDDCADEPDDENEPGDASGSEAEGGDGGDK